MQKVILNNYADDDEVIEVVAIVNGGRDLPSLFQRGQRRPDS